MPLSAVTGAWGSIRLNITKRHVRDPALAGIDHPDALTAGRRRRGCACVTHGGPGQHGASSRPALAGRGITRAGHKRESPPPLLADLDCAVRGPGPVTPRLPGALSLTASPPHRGSACHRPKSHAPGTFALAARRAGCGRGNRWLARTRADGELRRGGRSRPPPPLRSAGTAVPAGWVRAQASRAMKLQIVTSARQRTMSGSGPAATWPGSWYTPATARTVVCSPAGESVRSASRAGNTAPPGPVACQRSHSRALPAVSARSAGSTPASRGSDAAGPAACTRPVIPRGRRIWRRPAVRRLRQGAAAGIGRHQS